MPSNPDRSAYANSPYYEYDLHGRSPDMALNWPSLFTQFNNTVATTQGGLPNWFCSADTCDTAGLPINSSQWNISGSQDSSTPATDSGLLVNYCLAKRSVEDCKLQYSSTILVTVIASNIIKLFSIIVTLKTIRGQHLITIEGAIASFLIEPDPETKGACLATKSEYDLRHTLVGYNLRYVSDDKASIKINDEGITWAINAGNDACSLRWRHAVSRTRWIVCFTLQAILFLVCGISLLAVIIFVIVAGDSSNAWSVNFASLDANTLITINKASITSITLLANSPQLVFSFLYFIYNGLYTCMLTSFEWGKFAQHKKVLRVTSPTHVQRSTYWLRLPYTYGLPLSAACSLMHWLISQSIFLARINVYDQYGQRETGTTSNSTPSGSISTCGYNVLAMIVASVVGTLMLFALRMTGRKKLNSGIPLVGSCSLAISAACHRPPGDQDAAFKPIKWGAVKHETDQGPGHCCLTTYNVEPPMPGQRYAGYEEE